MGVEPRAPEEPFGDVTGALEEPFADVTEALEVELVPLKGAEEEPFWPDWLTP